MKLQVYMRGGNRFQKGRKAYCFRGRRRRSGPSQKQEKSKALPLGETEGIVLRGRLEELAQARREDVALLCKGEGASVKARGDKGVLFSFPEKEGKKVRRPRQAKGLESRQA